MANYNKYSNIKELYHSPPNKVLPYFASWQTSTGPKDLGIARFMFDMYMISKRFNAIEDLIRDFIPKQGVAPWAAQALASYYYWVPGMSKEDRTYVYGTFREGSKTFWWLFSNPLYDMCVGRYGAYWGDNIMPVHDYQIFRCKTGKEAKKRLMGINSFIRHPAVIEMFGEFAPTYQQVRKKQAKDESGFLRMSNGFIFEGSGIETTVRGSNVNQARPKRIIFDDPQNKDNTKTPESRQLCDREVMEESFGAVVKWGSIAFIGNKVHSDDTLGKLLDKENEQWKKQRHAITYRINEKGEREPGVGNLEKEKPSWPLRDTIESIKKTRDWYAGQPKLGGIKGWLKEFFNIIQSDADYDVKLRTMSYERIGKINWVVIEDDGKKEYRNVNIAVAMDPAISEKADSSDCAISAVAMDAFGRRYLLALSTGKYDIHDRFDLEINRPAIMARTPEQLSHVIRRGSVEEYVRMYTRYSADSGAIEVAGQQEAYYNDTLALFRRIGQRCSILKSTVVGTGSKYERDKVSPMGYFEQGLYYINDKLVGLDKVVVEVNTFAKESKKDIIDSIHHAEKVLVKPSLINYDHFRDFMGNSKRKEKFVTSFDKYDDDYVEPWMVS
jgi:hypothetical protein